MKTQESIFTVQIMNTTPTKKASHTKAIHVCFDFLEATEGKNFLHLSFMMPVTQQLSS
jgi:hypothetical protein